MKKILLALVIAFSFGTAVAKNDNDFVFKKAPTTLDFLLKAGDNQVNSGYQCEQDCWDDKTSCIASGENRTYCLQVFIQCIDTCEGAGGLYQ